MRSAILLAVIACSLVCFNCSSTEDNTIIRQRIGLIKTWHLIHGSTDPRLVDLVIDTLRKKFALTVVDDKCTACGEIRLTVEQSPKGDIEYIDIAILDSNLQLITRSRVWNDIQTRIALSDDMRRNNRSYNQSLADLLSTRISDLLARKHELTTE